MCFQRLPLYSLQVTWALSVSSRTAVRSCRKRSATVHSTPQHLARSCGTFLHLTGLRLARQTNPSLRERTEQPKFEASSKKLEFFDAHPCVLLRAPPSHKYIGGAHNRSRIALSLEASSKDLLIFFVHIFVCRLVSWSATWARQSRGWHAASDHGSPASRRAGAVQAHPARVACSRRLGQPRLGMRDT